MDKKLHPKKWGVRALINSQISRVQLLEFRNGKVISSYTLLDMWSLTHAEMEGYSCDQKEQLVAIVGVTALVHCHLVESMQRI